MARWWWRGVFSVEVPEGWQVRDFSEGVEFVPPDDSAAVHFSSHRREEPKAPEVGEASEWVRDFLLNNLAAEAGDHPPESPTPFGRACMISFVQDGEDAPRYWEVGVHLWPERAVFFTYNHDAFRPDLQESARSIFRSAEPDASG
ncbi:MAG: hypothetical protein ABI649_10240 [Gaiellaceae bacterium]